MQQFHAHPVCCSFILTQQSQKYAFGRQICQHTTCLYQASFKLLLHLFNTSSHLASECPYISYFSSLSCFIYLHSQEELARRLVVICFTTHVGFMLVQARRLLHVTCFYSQPSAPVFTPKPNSCINMQHIHFLHTCFSHAINLSSSHFNASSGKHFQASNNREANRFAILVSASISHPILPLFSASYIAIPQPNEGFGLGSILHF